MSARILLVDDEKPIREYMRCCVQSLHPESVDLAEDEGAVALAERLQPHVAVVDMQLGPDLEGPDLVRAIAQASPDTRFVLVTGTREIGIAARMVGILDTPHVSGFLFKPFEPEELCIAVSRAITERLCGETTPA